MENCSRYTSNKHPYSKYLQESTAREMDNTRIGDLFPPYFVYIGDTNLVTSKGFFL